MGQLLETIEALETTFGLLMFLSFAYVVPSRLIQSSLRKHYRDWIVDSGAYWHRAYDKWIVSGRVFYTDEFLSDVVASLFYGILFGFIGYWVLFHFIQIENRAHFLIGTIISSSILLFLLTETERIRLIDAELKIKKFADPNFDSEEEMKKLMKDQRWVKRIVKSKKPIS